MLLVSTLRLLVTRARKIAQEYQLRYGEPIPVSQLVQRVASVMQEYTQSGSVQESGVAIISKLYILVVRSFHYGNVS